MRSFLLGSLVLLVGCASPDPTVPSWTPSTGGVKNPRPMPGSVYVQTEVVEVTARSGNPCVRAPDADDIYRLLDGPFAARIVQQPSLYLKKDTDASIFVGENAGKTPIGLELKVRVRSEGTVDVSFSLTASDPRGTLYDEAQASFTHVPYRPGAPIVIEVPGRVRKLVKHTFSDDEVTEEPRVFLVLLHVDS